MANFLIQITDEQQAKIGTCKTREDAQAAFNLLVEQSDAPKTEQKVVLLADVESIVAKQIQTFTASTGDLFKKVTDVEAKVSGMNFDGLVEKAEAAGSKAAAKVLGKVGASGSSAVDSNPNEGQTNPPVAKNFAAIVADYVASGKSKPDAVIAAISSHPKEYAEARKAGNITL